ncbi:MAG: SGNH/GDSL hydrolase family protein [Bradyrhizobiaceae bacterium]|nr:SGNH/GDSL hydrolase family protein [Bradyrhizobiaceae bacterium]
MRVAAALAASLALAPAALATDERCSVPSIYVEPLAPLQRATGAAKRDRKLDILLLSGSPSQTGATKGLRSYPSFFDAALRRRFPELSVNLTVRAAARRTVKELLPTLDKLLKETQPSLVIWQAGTADAYRGVSTEDFAASLLQGIETVLRSGADVVLIDMQYSPRTEQLIDASDYRAAMRNVANATDVPLFSRYDIMRFWNDFGAFDLTSLKNDGLYEQVHLCIGELLAGFVARATDLDEFRGTGK